MASDMRRCIQLISTLLLLTSQFTLSAKTNSRPVYEDLNEPPKEEEKLKILSTPGNLPYGNPLAGNSMYNAKLHAHNQQAMFNAERIRQHKALSQSWMKTPHIDYMRSYHESEESRQLALEQQQANQKEDKQVKPANKTKEHSKRIRIRNFNTTKPSKDEVTVKPEKIRNQRSYGVTEYEQYLDVQKYQTLFKEPPKPEAHDGVKQVQSVLERINTFNNQPIESSINYVYPKFYRRENYPTMQEIETLNSLLNKNPKDQLTGFNALINSDHDNTNDKQLETPIDLYFYLKDPSVKALSEYYENTKYAQLNEDTITKDHIPRKEQVNNIENPQNRNPKLYIQQTQTPKSPLHITEPKSNQYNAEEANQILNVGYNPLLQENDAHLNQEETKPKYYFGHPSTAYYINAELKPESDLSKQYLHYNQGVQHLTDDGQGVSAYGGDDLHYAANYEFGYRVRDDQTGNDFGHHEAKKGDETNGHYHVLLPDGRMQNVRYSAGPEGFHADISYDHF